MHTPVKFTKKRLPAWYTGNVNDWQKLSKSAKRVIYNRFHAVRNSALNKISYANKVARLAAMDKEWIGMINEIAAYSSGYRHEQLIRVGVGAEIK